MKEIEIYVAKAFADLPDSRRKEELMQEIVQRLEQSANAHISAGKTREDAVNKAIVDFGELSELLTELKGQESGASSRSLLWFSIVASLIIMALMVFINFYYSPHVIWCVYPIFALLWWPLCILFFGKWRQRK